VRKVKANTRKMAEAPEEKQTWQEAVREQQQMFYEMFADRDWDCYKESEMVYLEMNIGHAVYGLPKELPDKSNGDTGNVDGFGFDPCQLLCLHAVGCRQFLPFHIWLQLKHLVT
jgi:hypothetical protein